MTPEIKILEETKLVGIRLKMSFSEDRTVDLWKSFSPRKKEVNNSINSDLYSVEIYPDSNFFKNFNPVREYTKWAAIKVSDLNNIPEGMEKLIIPEGKYAVFHYKGKPGEAKETFRFIYNTWLPNSENELDERPYFALMGKKYKGENPDSEENFWIPIKYKILKQ